MQKIYKKICKKYAKRCIDPTSIDLMKKKSKNIQEICKKYEWNLSAKYAEICWHSPLCWCRARDCKLAQWPWHCHVTVTVLSLAAAQRRPEPGAAVRNTLACTKQRANSITQSPNDWVFRPWPVGHGSRRHPFGDCGQSHLKVARDIAESSHAKPVNPKVWKTGPVHAACVNRVRVALSLGLHPTRQRGPLASHSSTSVTSGCQC